MPARRHRLRQREGDMGTDGVSERATRARGRHGRAGGAGGAGGHRTRRRGSPQIMLRRGNPVRGRFRQEDPVRGRFRQEEEEAASEPG